MNKVASQLRVESQLVNSGRLAIALALAAVSIQSVNARTLNGGVSSQGASSTAAATTSSAAPTLTPIFCNYTAGTSGPPSETFCRFINSSGKMCLNFGVSDVDDLVTQTMIGGSLDNTKGITFNSLSFVVKNYNASAASYLNIYLNFKNTTTGPTRYAYAIASAPSSRVKLANGDYQLTFKNTAFTPIYGGTMTGAIIQNMTIGTLATRTYPVRSYLIHSVTANTTALKTNTSSNGPVRNCTF